MDSKTHVKVRNAPLGQTDVRLDAVTESGSKEKVKRTCKTEKADSKTKHRELGGARSHMKTSRCGQMQVVASCKERAQN